MATAAFRAACEDLPVFRLDQASDALFYAPGYLVVVPDDQADSFAAALRGTDATGEAGELRRRATDAVASLAGWSTRPFEPLCLTLFLHDGCNLRCSYCVSDPTRRPTQRVALDDVRSAAMLVLAGCRRRGSPFTLVCHGGGEPTLDPEYLFEILDAVDALAGERGVPVVRYLATNGVMAPAVARAVAERFDIIGLSCDGPEAVQSLQRPLRSGRPSTPFVEAMAVAAHTAGTPLHVRTTVLPATYHRLPEITEYVCQELQPAQMTVEPVYVGGRATAADCARADDVDAMVTAFLRSETIARTHGVGWTTTGSRPDEVHGPYCNVFREVLNVVPGGAATACFKMQDSTSTAAAGLRVGGPSPDGRTYAVDERAIGALRVRLDPSETCEGCFNRFHCVRTCPDQCPVAGPVATESFRCRFQRELTTRRLQRTAAALDGDRTRPRGAAL